MGNMTATEAARLRRSVQRFFYGLIVMIILLIALGINQLGWDRFSESLLSITGGELVVGLGTIFLALFTAALVVRSSEDAEMSRELTIDENRKFRRKEHLLRQLEFYSSLKGELTSLSGVDKVEDRLALFDESTEKVQAQWKYELWGEPELRALMSSYFGGIRNSSVASHKPGLNDEDRKNLETKNNEANRILSQIDSDFSKLKDEYLA